MGAAVGYPLGSWVGETLFPLGWQGRMIGLVVATLYFGLCESRVGGGRSLGKRLLGLRVVGADGGPLPVGRSFARATIFLVPIFVNGVAFAATSPLAVWALLPIGVLLFGLGGAILLTLAFNRRTRQGIHDLVARAFVIRYREGSAGAAISVRAARWPGVVSAAWIAAVAVAAAVTLTSVPGVPPWVTPLLVEAPGVRSWSVSTGKQWLAQPGQPTVDRRFVTVVIAYSGPEENGPLMRRIARKVIENDRDAATANGVGVVVLRGWDLGFVSGKSSEWENRSPGEWRREWAADDVSETP